MRASKQPMVDIAAVTKPGQDPKMRQYRPGYEYFMDALPEMHDDDQLLSLEVQYTEETIKQLGAKIVKDGWLQDDVLNDGDFKRTIVAIESPRITFNPPGIVEGKELVVAQWGNGFTSPVHGHSTGYLHEEVLFGRVRVNTYRKTGKNIARPLRTEIVGEGTFASLYTAQNPFAENKRETLIHNFTSIGYSATLHYLPEHTRDGKDNGFAVEYFDDVWKYQNEDLKRIKARDAMYSRIGDVILVRSENVPEYGDHYIVITGEPVMKPHGLRPQDVAIGAPKNRVLDYYRTQMGLTLLKLESDANKAFLDFHGIKLIDNKIIFPEA